MARYPKGVERLIVQFSKLPGIGAKTAEKLAFFLLEQPAEERAEFADAVARLDDGILRCETCFNFAEKNPCAICSNTQRANHIICVVARPQDVEAIEKTNMFDGVYHVLGGTIDPVAGRHHDHLRITELMTRLTDIADQAEVILALSPDIPGETTMLYLTKLLKEAKINTSRLARGLPVGSDLEYADDITLTSALKGREKL